MASSEEIQSLLRALDEAVQRSTADSTIDEEERSELRALVGRLEDALSQPGEEHEGVVDHLESTAVRFEGDHPKLAALLRSAVDSLTGYGI